MTPYFPPKICRPQRVKQLSRGFEKSEKICVTAPLSAVASKSAVRARITSKASISIFRFGKLTVVTGPSGSGKSSLAFDTIYAEGQRRYVETFSPYMRQFLERMDKPRVEDIRGIPPAIAIEQSNLVKTSRSSVGTITEINDFLKLFWARTARAFCPNCGREIRPETAKSIADQVFALFNPQNDPSVIPSEVEGSRRESLKVKPQDPSTPLRSAQDDGCRERQNHSHHLLGRCSGEDQTARLLPISTATRLSAHLAKRRHYSCR